jgi:hypothetical protein
MGNGTETFNKMKQAYGEHALSRSQVFKCHKAFSEGLNPLKMNPTLEDLQLRKVMALWRKCEPFCGQTFDSQYE